MSASAGINAAIVGQAAISFYNDSSFIRAHNANTDSIAYFQKSNVIFQADSSSAFWLQSDDIKTHYLYADVIRPSSTNVKNLLETLQSWVEDSEPDRESGPFVSDATTTVLEVKDFYDKDLLRMQEVVAGGGTCTYNAGQNAVTLTLTTSQTSRAVRQTRHYASLINNKRMYAAVSALLISSTSARNVTSKVGVFDDNADVSQNLPSGNGIFFQYTSGGQGISVVLRSNYTSSQVDVVVNQADWNIDKLDGTGSSSKILDPTVEQTFLFEWAAFGGQVVRVGYLQDGFAVWCHAFRNVRLGCASLPLRWEITRTDAALATTDNDAASMVQSAGTVMIQGNNDGAVISRGVANTMVKSVTAANSPVAILAARLGLSRVRAYMNLRRVTICNLDQGVAKWSLVLNPLWSYSASWYNSGLGSFATFSETTDVLVASTDAVLASGFVSQGITTYDLTDKQRAMTGTLSGGYDQVMLVVTYLRGTVALSAAFDWTENE